MYSAYVPLHKYMHVLEGLACLLGRGVVPPVSLTAAKNYISPSGLGHSDSNRHFLRAHHTVKQTGLCIVSHCLLPTTSYILTTSLIPRRVFILLQAKLSRDAALVSLSVKER